MNRLLFFLFIILSIIFTPNFGALDRATVQWFFLSIVPLIYFRLIFFKNVTNFIYILYCLFIVQVFLSLFYSNNISISIIDFSRDNIAMVLRELFRAPLHAIYDWCTNVECLVSGVNICNENHSGVSSLLDSTINYASDTLRWNHTSFIYLDFLASCNIRLPPNSCKFRKHRLSETDVLGQLRMHASINWKQIP